MERNEIVYLVNEEEREVPFAYFTEALVDEKVYVLLINQETNEIVITETVKDENGEDEIYVLGAEDTYVFEAISKSLLIFNNEDGQSGHIYMADLFKYNDKDYALCVISGQEGTAILEVVEGENGVVNLNTIPSDEEFQAVFDTYSKRIGENKDCKCGGECCCEDKEECCGCCDEDEECDCESSPQTVVMVETEDGGKVPFLIADIFPHDGKAYLVLLEDNAEKENPAILIMRGIIDPEEGVLVDMEMIEDLDELGIVAQAYEERLAEE